MIQLESTGLCVSESARVRVYWDGRARVTIRESGVRVGEGGGLGEMSVCVCLCALADWLTGYLAGWLADEQGKARQTCACACLCLSV